MNLEDRLKKNSRVNKKTGCIEWTGTKRNGYGRLIMGSRKWGTRRSESAHRVAYDLFVGPIPEGMWVLHKCDNPPCINPEHLFLGTRQDNIDDRERKQRNKVPGLKHEAHPNAKLDWRKVDKIRNKFAGATNVEIGAYFGVSPRTISDVRNCKTWVPASPEASDE